MVLFSSLLQTSFDSDETRLMNSAETFNKSDSYKKRIKTYASYLSIRQVYMNMKNAGNSNYDQQAHRDNVS